jgi:hypothetical protein
VGFTEGLIFGALIFGGLRYEKCEAKIAKIDTATKVILTVLINAILTKVRMAVLAWLH